MNADDQLKAWRDATESLTPTPKLMAALGETLAAAPPPPPPGAPAAPAAAGGGAAVTAVKVLLVTLVVGVIGFVALPRREVGPWTWFAKLGSRAAAGGGERCAPRPNRGLPTLPAAVAAPLQPVPGVVLQRPGLGSVNAPPVDPRVEFLAQLEARPLDCVAQRAPLHGLLGPRRGDDAERLRWSARYAMLCPLEGDSPWLFVRLGADPNVPSPSEAAVRCDDSDWCHDPPCELGAPGCVDAWLARPAGSCGAERVRDWLQGRGCQLFLLAKGEERERRAGELQRGYAHVAKRSGLRAQPWCLSPER